MTNPSVLFYEIQQSFLQRWRSTTTQFLAPLTRILEQLHIRANHLTALALVMSILSIIFFNAHALFVLFILLHFFFDILDGSMARRQGPTTVGKWFDYLNDSSLVLLLGLRFLYEEQSLLVLGMLLFYLLHHTVYIWSRMQGPILYGRTMLALAFVLKLYTVGIWIVFILSLLGIIAQLLYAMRKR